MPHGASSTGSITTCPARTADAIAEWSPGARPLFQLPRRQEVLKVRVSMDNTHHLQPQRIKARQDQLMMTARVNHNGFFW